MIRRLITGVIALAMLLSLMPFAAPPASASTSGVLISEFRFRGPSGGNDEYVELTNTSAAAVDISGWKLQGCSSTTGVASDRATVAAGVVIPAGAHFLFTNSAAVGGYSGTVPGDATYSVGFTDGAGARLLAPGSVVVDGVSGTLTALPFSFAMV